MISKLRLPQKAVNVELPATLP